MRFGTAREPGIVMGDHKNLLVIGRRLEATFVFLWIAQPISPDVGQISCHNPLPNIKRI